MRVFKYRGGKKKIFKRDLIALERNFFWGAKIDGLNDPCESLILSDKFDQQSKAIKYFLGTKAQDNLTRVKEAVLGLLEVNKRLGIYSLSKTYKDELLWAHYAYSHQGFCIEYDLEILKDGYRNKIFSFPVKYNNKPPDIDFSDLNSKSHELIHKMIGFKSKRWEYEKEYRIITDFAGEFFYPPNAVKAIYFGVRMPEKNKTKLIETLKGRGIKFYQIIQKPKTYKFERELLTTHNSLELTYMKRFKFQNGIINFELIESKYAELIKRGDIVIKVDQVINENEIRELSNYLRDQLFFKAERVLIQIYQQEQKDNICNWANSSLIDDKWRISINEFVL